MSIYIVTYNGVQTCGKKTVNEDLVFVIDFPTVVWYDTYVLFRPMPHI